HLGFSTGEFFPMGLNAEMPGDQRVDDAMSVCFETKPLGEGMDLLGAARLSLRVSCDQPFAFLVARLCDVGPDGASVRICHGVLNLRHRDSMEHPSPVPVGEAFEVGFALDQMGYRLAPGHRLRVAISTTYWPFLWPSPKAATVTLLQGALDLPIHAGSVGDEWLPPKPETAPGWKHRVLRAGTAARRVEHDLISGEIALVVEEDGGAVENLSHGLITGERMAERWTIHPEDPLSAKGYCVWEQSLARGNWSVRTKAVAQMHSDADGLFMTAKLEAWEGDQQVFVRDFSERVARDHL
ncbi:MAG: CocE/NonD family hydrolase C-terminal non-catalytic domain-containing protein, partial [Paracoccaceae bacterium]